MATIHRCDQCNREQSTTLPFKIERNSLNLTLGDDPNDPEFCTLECVVGWCITKMLNDGYTLNATDNSLTIYSKSGRISQINAHTTTPSSDHD